MSFNPLEIGISELANIQLAVFHYQKLIYTLPLLDPSQRESLTEFYDSFKIKYKDERTDWCGISESMSRDWNAIELRYTKPS